MGIRLIVEVLDYAPSTLTHREKLLLVALAEDANEDTRTTWNSVESPEILRRAKLTRAQLYAVLRKLDAKGVVKRTAAGQKNGTAKYELLPLAAQCPQIADTDDPSQCQQKPDTDASQCQQNADPGPEVQCQQNADADTSQCQQIADVSVSELRTPTPLNPSSTTPSSAQEGEPADDSGIPAFARPLVDQLTAAEVRVRWPFTPGEWLRVHANIKRSGTAALVEYGRKTFARKNGDIDSARFFLKGWSEQPPLPSADTERPPLRAVAGGWQPYANPTDHSVYENGF